LAELTRRVLETRFLVRGYVYQHTEEAAHTAFAGLDRARQQADQLRQLLPANQQTQLLRMAASLDHYREAIDAFKVGMDTTLSARGDLLAGITGLLEISNRMYLNQQRKMLADSQQARTQ